MKVGLYFGSFNPIHVGHLIIANVVLEATDIDRVWFVVSPQNPLKKSNSLLHEFDRYDLVELATASNYRLEPIDIEFKLPKPNYTINTITALSEKYTDKDFVLIIGQDNLMQFPRWRNYEQIINNYELLVYPRPGSASSELENHQNVKIIDAPLLDISATFIRNCVKEGRSIEYMVPPEVAERIRVRGYYETKP